MASNSAKHTVASLEEELPSETSLAREDEKTIPFLRRLRDMLVENEDAISFVPGCRNNGKTVLGRIVVHDRIVVESKVLPKYFNHSSFASLRRQLNYFSFVRLGKGRQRESIYINENVVDLQDVLHLKRRSTSSNSSTASAPAPVVAEEQVAAATERNNKKKKKSTTSSSSLNYVAAEVPVVHLPPSKNNCSSSSSSTGQHRNTKRRRLNNNKSSSNKNQSTTKSKPQPASRVVVSQEQETTTSSSNTSSMILTRTFSPINHFVSEDETTTTSSSEGSNKPYIALDLTKPAPRGVGGADDDEILAGCNALLGLAATTVWD